MKSMRMKMSYAHGCGALCVLVIVLIIILVVVAFYGRNSEGFSDYSPRGHLSPMSYKHPELIGPDDGLTLNPGNGSTWRGPLPDEPHLDIPSPTGEGIYLFYKNQVKPECCPSTYTTDTGCLCTTPEDRALINSRGGNRTPYTDSI